MSGSDGGDDDQIEISWSVRGLLECVQDGLHRKIAIRLPVGDDSPCEYACSVANPLIRRVEEFRQLLVGDGSLREEHARCCDLGPDVTQPLSLPSLAMVNNSLLPESLKKY